MVNELEDTPPKKRISLVRHMIGFVIGAPLIVAFYLVQSGTYQPFKIVSASMEPTLLVGDSVLMRPPKNIANWMNVIVIFPDPTRPDELLVKRVVAVGGDKLEFRRGFLYRNQERQPINSTRLSGNERKWTLLSDELFVLGDNRQDSFDSLNFGPIKVSSVRGIPYYRYWPSDRRGSLE